MDRILELVKSRIRQPDSPLKTVKAVAEAIDMSESGFYRMVERGTYKVPTLLALSKALDLKDDYFLPEASKKSSREHSVDTNGIEAILSELRILREQLQVKDRQIEKLLDLLGKPEGAIYQPLYTGDLQFDLMVRDYTFNGLVKLLEAPSNFFAEPVAK
ncbi:hypothetical protein [Spirosoma fluminis]